MKEKRKISEKNKIDERKEIRKKGLKFLKFRLRSVFEMREYLKKRGFDTKLIDEVINDFVNEELLDDQRFVQAFVSDYTKLKPKGNYFILRELKKRGIPQDEIDSALRTRDEKEIALNLIATRMKGLDRKNPKDRSKIMRRLFSRGFTPDIVYEILGGE